MSEPIADETALGDLRVPAHRNMTGQGQQTGEILLDLGYDQSRIDELRAAEIIG